MKFALDACGGATSKERRNANHIRAMTDGFSQEDVMNDTVIPNSLLEPPEHIIPVADHMKYTWKRCTELGMIIGTKVPPKTDNNSLFTGKTNTTVTNTTIHVI